MINKLYLSKSVEGCLARIELRDCLIKIQDGLAGFAAVGATGASGTTSLTLETPVLNTSVTDAVPVGARFTVVGETPSVVHTVTARTPAGSLESGQEGDGYQPSANGATGPTTEITFTPALASTIVPAATGVSGATGVCMFQPQELTVKIGDGNLTYTVHKDIQYVLDRGNLDTVREKDQMPCDVKMDAVYEHITTGTGEFLSPIDALKNQGAAVEWVSSATDKCEQYAVDLIVVQTPPCGGVQVETTLFPDFRYETQEFNLKDATIAVTGKCNATEPIVTRS
jgi:hypothetical protein